MPLTLPNPSSACRSFCDKPHKIPGVVDKCRKPVDNPPQDCGPICYLFQRLGKSSLPSLSISILLAFHIYTAKIIGEHKNKIRMIAKIDPIKSVITLSLVFYFACVFLFITNRLRRITATQFLNSFYFILK